MLNTECFKWVEVNSKKAKVLKRGSDIFRSSVKREACIEGSCKIVERFDHVFTWLEREEYKFCEMGNGFVPVAFLI